jgi:hypothetical protein
MAHYGLRILHTNLPSMSNSKSEKAILYTVISVVTSAASSTLEQFLNALKNNAICRQANY